MATEVQEIGEQAGMQAANWLTAACKHIDEEFGPGFAKGNPHLVAAMVKAAALDYHATLMANALDRHNMALSDLADVQREALE